MNNTFGHLFRVTTFGESHGTALGAVIDGCPPKIRIDVKKIQQELDRRKPGQKLTTPRKEKDKVEILSGIFKGKTLGTPIAMIVRNHDARSKDYKANIFRPGHADLAWELKYGFRDFRGGGRSSGRETVSRVMAGALAKQVISHFHKGLKISARALEIGGATSPKEMEKAILNAKQEKDSVGGIIEISATGMPSGLGEPVFDKLSSDLSKALFSIPGVKAVEIGSGIEAAILKGSEHNKRKKRGAGGISGGISTGENLEIRVTIKAPSSINIKGRHDPCIIPRAIPVAESMAAITLLDHMLRQKAIRS